MLPIVYVVEVLIELEIFFIPFTAELIPLTAYESFPLPYTFVTHMTCKNAPKLDVKFVLNSLKILQM